MGMILRIASSRIVGQGDIVGRSGYFSLNLSANSVMRGRLAVSYTHLTYCQGIGKYQSARLEGSLVATGTYILCLLYTSQGENPLG